MAQSFSSKLKEHLGQYRGDVLNVTEFGIRNGRAYEHILSNERRELNILPSIRDSFWVWFAQHLDESSLHRDFRHLNSSQAMAFNLFYPAIAGLDSGALLKVLGIEGVIDEFCFEKVLDAGEGTNFDCFIRLKTGSRCFFEVKLTEQEFGCCTDNPRRMAKLRDIYRARLSSLVPERCLEPSFFFRHYQLLRNISYLHENPADRLFLIFPRANEKLSGTADWLKQHVVETVRPRIQVRFVEDLIAACMANSSLAVWREFETKYCGRSQPTT
jgi:hypothetical protein